MLTVVVLVPSSEVEEAEKSSCSTKEMAYFKSLYVGLVIIKTLDFMNDWVKGHSHPLLNYM